MILVDVKKIENLDIMSIKREVKVEVEETKKIKVEAYCYLCQMHGHILSKKCIAMTVVTKDMSARTAKKNGESKSVNEYIEEEDEFMKNIKIKTEVYCILF